MVCVIPGGLFSVTLPIEAGIASAAGSLIDKAKGLPEGIKKLIVFTLSNQEDTNILRDAIHIRTERVIRQVRATNGFNGDTKIHKSLPNNLQTVQATLRKFGLSNMADELKVRLNYAAVAATPKVKQLFMDAVSQMTLDEVGLIWRIYRMASDAATQNLHGKIIEPLNPI